MDNPVFNQDQIESLNAYQKSGVFHPFTCGGEGCRETLTATPDGWICPKCDYTQKWAHKWMMDGSWKAMDPFGRF